MSLSRFLLVLEGAALGVVMLTNTCIHIYIAQIYYMLH